MQVALATPALRRVILMILPCAVLAVSASCSSPPVKPPLTPTQKVERDERIGSGLAAQFEQRLSLVSNRAVDAYLGSLLARLNGATLPGARVLIYRPASGALWAFFGLPVQRIYVPAPYLKAVEFESELAAALAMQSAHLQLDHTLSRLPEGELENPDFDSEKGLFSFDEKECLAAVKGAAANLYRSGFDGRGLVAWFERFKAHPEVSPYDEERLDKMIDLARREIALSSPLRNPIVRSPAFMAIQARLRRL
jgi:predicted Zn-dependent protease